MGRAGIEPACPFRRQILSLLCLPIPPPSHIPPAASRRDAHRVLGMFRAGPALMLDTLLLVVFHRVGAAHVREARILPRIAPGAALA